MTSVSLRHEARQPKSCCGTTQKDRQGRSVGGGFSRHIDKQSKPKAPLRRKYTFSFFYLTQVGVIGSNITYSRTCLVFLFCFVLFCFVLFCLALDVCYGRSG